MKRESGKGERFARKTIYIQQKDTNKVLLAPSNSMMLTS